jgi:hypothetical protein
MNKKFLLSILLGVALTLTACEPRKEPIEKKIDRTGKPITVTTYVYSTQRQLDEAFRAIHNIPRGEDVDSRYGFARWQEWRDGAGNVIEIDEQLTCELHILDPKYVDDEATLTLGHEMIHCLYGSYHE